VGSRSFFYEADEVVAAGGDFCEPEMSGRVGSGCAEIGNEAFFCLEPGQRFLRAIGRSAWSYGAFRGSSSLCRCTGCGSDIVIEPISGVGSDGDEMDWSAWLGDCLSGMGYKKGLSGQRPSPFLFVGEQIFFVQDGRLCGLGGRCGARFGGLCVAGTQASQQECYGYGRLELVMQWHRRYEVVDEDDDSVSSEDIAAGAALCLRARPLSGVGSVTIP
jgi:hypothetical protein